MKLTRITKLKHRVFRDFAWPNGLHAFAQFNVIYGWNGCGKTTLSSLLSLAEKKTALTDGEIELEFDGAMRVAGSAFPSAQLPHIRVFNRDFIASTLSQAGGIAPIYFIGEDSVEKQAQIEELRQTLISAKVDQETAQSAKATADAKLDEFCKNQAKLIKELLTTANSQTYNNYDKRRFRGAVEGLDTDGASNAILDDDRKATLVGLKNEQAKPNIETVNVPFIDLDSLSLEVEALVTRSVIAEQLDELAADARLAAWTQEGLSLHSGEYPSDTCRFCQQQLPAMRRARLEAHFNNSFANLQSDLAHLLTKLNAAKGDAGSLHLPDISRFYGTLTSKVSSANAEASKAATETEAALDALIARVEAKRDNPFAPATAVPPTANTSTPIADSISTFNAIIAENNLISTQFRTSVAEACRDLEASYVAEAHAEFALLSQAVKAADAALKNFIERSTRIQSQIDELERAIVEHRRPADELNDELRAYLGRDELSFAVSGPGYALTRNGQPVSHLSEGERTAIAFLYFLKSLQDKTFDLSHGIVVIDDPVSSLDANALYSAFGYMKERTKHAGQLFIFTHSFPFFRLVRNWFHHLPKQRSPNDDRRPARFFQLHSRRHIDGSRTSELAHLDRLLQENESEYQYLFKRVYHEAHRDDSVDLEHHYGLPNVARRLIEAFLAFRFPEMSGELGPRMDRVTFDNAKKTRILRLLNTYSHAGAIADPEHDLSLLAETRPVLRDVLALMEAADKDHYDGMKTLVTQSDPLATSAGQVGNDVATATSGVS